MTKEKTSLEGVYIITPQVFGDNRGWFCETYSAQKLREIGIDTVFVQDNQSYSKGKNTIRGLHFQLAPKAQTKLLRCTRGKILDVAVDIRKGSPQFGKWVAVELSAENKKMIYIPKGFAHAFLTLSEDVEVQYKVDQYYSPTHDRSILFSDPAIGIEWGINNPILSEKDLNAPLLSESDVNYIFGENC
ncbi:MAG: dTDP-4-dehydrorhamnose 3,5-epimerase [Clostridia bacterium]|nr:dTDP-4-dehydrorhamnose 3,5-epimerase [Clostridia bacterium]